jgi:acetyl-CoA carboxylase biotin carboxylase subunit
VKKVLIANRGEIAVRIARACRELGLRTAAVFSECDRTSLHVRCADEAFAIGASPARDSYLNIDRLIAAAHRAGADAVHPGYGFLAENVEFAAAVRGAGLTFIGPSPEAVALLGSKTAARHVARSAGVSVVPGANASLPHDATDDAIVRAAEDVGYPLLIKAVGGGGGKGMRAVSRREELAAAVRASRSEAATAFGAPDVYLERRLAGPRHVEVQILGDEHGRVLPFVERECSVQRRYQKVLEETPSSAVSPTLRRAMAEAAQAVARSVGYTNAGTVEFLLDEDGRFYFLEVNTRLQVEHPITEAVTGVDLVQWQIRIARGEPLSLDPERLLEPSGHAIECRINAEDPDNGFLPSPGRITRLRPASGPGIRDDTGGSEGSEVPIFYDPLIAKLIAWAEDRQSALARMRRGLSEYVVGGIKTTIPFFAWLLDQPAFVDGRVSTSYLDELLDARGGQPFASPDAAEDEVAAIAAVLYAGLGRAGADGTLGAAATPAGRWRTQGRVEGLR